jgi:hypothetical protein
MQNSSVYIEVANNANQTAAVSTQLKLIRILANKYA